MVSRTKNSNRTKTRPPRLQPLESRELLNAAPIAGDDVYLISVDETATFGSVTLNDADADGDLLSIQSVSEPQHGTLTNLGDNRFQYVPNSDFAGRDSFRYVVADPIGATDEAEVVIAVNRRIDESAARAEILAGVSSIGNPVQPGKMVAFGPDATSLAYYSDGIEHGPLAVAAGWGNGRVIAMPDHQSLDLNRVGNEGDTARFIENSVAWLATSASKDIKIVTYNSSSNASFLRNEGYTDVVNVSSLTATSRELGDADVFVAGWLGSNPSNRLLDATAEFVRDGGGLFVAEYGVGYDWWWNKDISAAPGNILLREAGIGFGVDIIWSGDPLDTTNTARGKVDASVVLDVLAGGRHSSRVKEEAGYNLSQLFRVLPEGDSLLAELDSFYETRIATLNPAPGNAVSDPFEQALLSREMSLLEDLPPYEVTAHRTAEAVYGEIPSNAERVDGVFTVDAETSLWHATGFYAAPGEVVTISVPRSVVGRGYEVRINGHRDNISRRDDWDRVPFGVSRTFPLDAETIQVANAFGGSIYIDVGSDTPASLAWSDFDVTIGNALHQPHFVLGETTDEQWQGIRDNPAPYAEFVSDHVAFSVPSAWIRELDDPTALMQFWDDTGARQDYVGALEQFRTAPERFNVDVQISVGLLHAGYPIQGPTWASEEIVDFASLQSTGNWGYFHELGHQMQSRPDRQGNYYTFPGDVEVTVNIFANASLEHSVIDSPTDGWGYSAYPILVMERALETVEDNSEQDFDDKDPYPFYFQLSDAFGFETYREVFQTYHDDLENGRTLPSTGQQKKDEFYVRWSEVSGFDMTQYMVELWGLEVSSAAKRRVANMSLPDFLPAFAGTVGSIPVARDASVTLDLNGGLLSYDGVASIGEVSDASNGEVAKNGDGTWTYYPNVGFEGTDELTFTVVSSTGYSIDHTVALQVKTQGILLETFTGISGNSIANLTRADNYPAAPNESVVLDSFEAPVNRANNFGARARGWVTAPATGQYTFYIASDDNGELHLGRDDDPASARRIAHVPGWSSSRQWTKFPEQRSSSIRLVEGQRYYIEALMKEGGGGDNLAVAWDGPGFSREVIPGDALEVYYEGNALPVANDDVVQSHGRVVIDVLANDSDRNGDRLTLSSVSRPANGTASIVDERIVYEATNGFVGEDAFTYTVSDGNGGTAVGTVTVTATAPGVTAFYGADNVITLVGDNVQLVGLDFVSKSGLLEPVNTADPFTIVLSNTPEHIAIGNLGSSVVLEGSLTTTVRYLGDDPASDLTASYGNLSSEVIAFPVTERAEPEHDFDCNEDGQTDASDLNCSCEAGAVDELLSHLNLDASDLDADGVVGFSDFLIMSESFGERDAAYSDGDLDCTGAVDFADFLILSANYGATRA